MMYDTPNGPRFREVVELDGVALARARHDHRSLNAWRGAEWLEKNPFRADGTGNGVSSPGSPPGSIQSTGSTPGNAPIPTKGYTVSADPLMATIDVIGGATDDPVDMENRVRAAAKRMEERNRNAYLQAADNAIVR
jgi:hypothetical protein